MAYTKGEFIDAALAEIGISADVFTVPVERRTYCLQRLDSMMGEWSARGLGLNYPLPSSPSSSSESQNTSVSDAANEAIITNLAVRIAPSFGKQVLPATITAASNSFSTLLAKYSVVPQRVMRAGFPIGAGNKYRNNFNPFTVGGEGSIL